MWLMVLFDLPTETKKQRKVYAQFRKKLLQHGFNMFQFSVYTRHCASREIADVYKRMIKQIVPDEGIVGVIEITDKQFEKIEIYYGKKRKDPPPPPQQLTLF
ncbi:MAG: CRISPR-associated endonuclease Cas2 [Bacteroidales bacterium]|nr:CRISPR-associated endonuclease Cas2 [Bacteroidales bacterium]